MSGHNPVSLHNPMSVPDQSCESTPQATNITTIVPEIATRYTADTIDYDMVEMAEYVGTKIETKHTRRGVRVKIAMYILVIGLLLLFLGNNLSDKESCVVDTFKISNGECVCWKCFCIVVFLWLIEIWHVYHCCCKCSLMACVQQYLQPLRIL